MRGVCIGVDLGGTNLRCALVAREGAIIRRQSLATDIGSGRASFLSRLLSVLNRLQQEARGDDLQLLAAGLGVPGLISPPGEILSSVNLLPLEGLNLAREVASALGLPAVALNDANAGAIGEQRFGAGRGFRSSLMLTIGTGVGGGLILDDRLWTGCDGAAGEFGHITVEPEGRPCGCGNRGCLEQYVSAGAIAAGAGAAQAGDNGGAAAVAARALRGDAEAARVFEQAGRYLGIAAAGVVNLLNLEGIILGGGLAQSFELLAAPMRREVAARAFALPAATVRIVKGELGDDAGILGAAAAAFEAQFGSAMSG